MPPKIVYIILLALSLTACFGTPLKTSKNKSIADVSYWKAKGKISVRFEDRRESAYFTWESTGNDYQVHFHGLFGQGGVHLKRTDGSYTLTSNDIEKEASTPEELMQNQLGWSIPLSGMEYWIRGIRSPQSKAFTFLPDNAIHEQDWLITYPKRDFADGYLVPKKLVGAYKDIKLKIAISSWDIKEDYVKKIEEDVEEDAEEGTQDDTEEETEDDPEGFFGD